MATWKFGLLCAVILIVILLLYPTRRLGTKSEEGDAVEIVLMGPNTGSILDVYSAFEKWSADRHARDPRQPRYRLIFGQNAARDQVADPTRFLLAEAGGSPPDVIYFDRFAVTEWSARGAFIPLDDFIRRDLARGQNDPPPPTAERFFKSCWDETMYRGHVYAIPNGVDDRVLFYNKDLLVRAGLVDERSEARPPRDWNELREYSRRLTEYDEKHNLRVVGYIPNYGNCWLYMYGWMNGGEFMSPDGKRCTLNEPRIVEALTYMKTLYDDMGGYEKVLAFQAGFQSGQLDPFIQGKVAMKIDTGGAMNGLARYGKDVNFGLAPPPLSLGEIARRKASGKPLLLSWSGGWSYAIPSNARHKDAAWEFIRFMTSEQAIEVINASEKSLADAQGVMYIPPLQPQPAINRRMLEKYIFDDPLVPEKFRDGIRVSSRLIPYSRYRPVTPVGQRLWNEHVIAMENACYQERSGMNPRQALDFGAANVQRDLDKFFSPQPGRPMRNWQWFYLLYAVLIIALAGAAYLWDTKLAFRRRLGRWLRISRAADTDIVEGTKGGYFRRQWWSALTCAAPWIIGFLIFGGGPMLFSFIISFTDYDILRPPLFTGLRNYRAMFTDDAFFLKSLGNTAYMMLGVPLGMAVGLAIALLLNLKIRGMSIWRTFFYLPAIVPMVAASVLWVWILNPNGGLLNSGLATLHIANPPNWLQSADWSKPSLIIMGLWGAGSGMIIWLAGLKAIPQELYEAAGVDGANGWQQFRHVTLPQLSPYIFFNLVMGLIGTFQIFGQAFIMTAGGPANSTLFYVYHLFNNAFRYGHMGYASAMAWVLLVLVLILTIIQFRLSKRWVYYEGD